MLFFIDESWQVSKNNKYKVGVLSAVQLKSYDFNECSQQIYKLKLKNLGSSAGSIELKGRQVLRRYLFKLESEGIQSMELNLVRDMLSYVKTLGIALFGSVVLEQKEIDLACADVNQLERPFFYLFERIDLFMKENYPDMMAKIIFDDRGIQINKKISASISNFFHKCTVGQSFSNIIKVPCFGISTENVGIQIADIIAYILAGKFTEKKEIGEFYRKVKELEFKSKKSISVNGKNQPYFGFKVIKKKEAGVLSNPGRVI